MNSIQMKLAVKLSKLVNKMTGKGGISISMEDGPAAREKYPDTYKAYLKLRREFNGVWRKELSKLAKKSKYMEMKQLLAYLEAKNIDHTIPEGFNGIIDHEGKWHIFDGEEILLIDGVPNSFIFPKVRMNKHRSKNSPWVFQAMRADGTGGNYYYTRQFKKEGRVNKFQKVKDLVHMIDDIRSNWTDLILNYDHSNPNCSAAIILELLYQFSARIGSEGNGTREGVKTYGIGTLRVKHCTITDTSITFSYLGKDGVKTKHAMFPSDPIEWKIYKVCKKLIRDRKPSDELFTYSTKGGKVKPVRSGVVNALFRNLGAECNVHKLRTYQATKIAQQMINLLKHKRHRFNDKKAKEALLKVAEKVGKELNHVRRTKEGKQKITGHTALSAYIDIDLQAEFYKHFGVQLPKNLQKLLS